MHRGLLTVLAACTFPFAVGSALAAGPAPEGATATVKFRVTVQEKSTAEYASTAIARVLSAQCTMIAAPAMQISSAGPTAEQEAAVQASAARAEALAQPGQPSMDIANKVAAEAEKCGDDEACLTALAMQMSQDPEFLAQQPNLKANMQAAAGLDPNLGPVRYQQWHSQSCTGELQVNDTYVTSDPGGEGGAGAYTDTVTVKSTGAIAPWPGLFMETDVVNGTTQYRIAPPAPIKLPSNSSISGAGSMPVELLGSTALPQVLGPYPGVMGKHKGSVKGKDGTISLEWSSAQ
jgi:hypothetical protein